MVLGGGKTSPLLHLFQLLSSFFDFSIPSVESLSFEGFIPIPTYHPPVKNCDKSKEILFSNDPVVLVSEVLPHSFSDCLAEGLFCKVNTSGLLS